MKERITIAENISPCLMFTKNPWSRQREIEPGYRDPIELLSGKLRLCDSDTQQPQDAKALYGCVRGAACVFRKARLISKQGAARHLRVWLGLAGNQAAVVEPRTDS